MINSRWIELPKVEYLRECFALEENGTLRWKVRPRKHFRTERGWRSFNAQRSGRAAGVPTTGGYLVICIAKRLYKVHRIVFALANGRPPEQEIDHKDGDPTNNHPLNLRAATPSQNQLNKGKWSKRKNEFKGVYPRESGKYEVKLRLPGGQSLRIGLFATKRAAAEAHTLAVVKHHGEFGRSHTAA